MKRMLLAALAALFTLAFATATANATSPDPYNTSSGTGQLSTTSITGRSSCDLFNITGGISGNTGTITNVSDRNCSGVITDIVSILPITILVDLSLTDPNVTVHINGVTIRNILFGECLYTGLLIGRGTDGTGDAQVTGTLNLDPSRSGGTFICTPDALVILDVTFPGLTL